MTSTLLLECCKAFVGLLLQRVEEERQKPLNYASQSFPVGETRKEGRRGAGKARAQMLSFTKTGRFAKFLVGMRCIC